MEVGIYGKRSVGPLREIAEGFRVLGHDAIFRTPKYFEPSHAEDRFDLVVVQGLRRKRRAIFNTYQEMGVPVLLQDTAHLRRDLKGSGGMVYRKLVAGGQEWIPPVDCPPDRLESLDVEVSKDRGPGEDVVIAGQVPGDSQHDLSEHELSAWYHTLVGRLRECTDRRLIWRPHPVNRQNLRGVDEVHERVSVRTSLMCAHAVVSYNSTFGLDALMAGVPAYCEGPQTYSGISPSLDELEDIDEVELPSYEQRMRLLRRVAYTQWTNEEFASGSPQAFLLSVIEGGDVVWPGEVPDSTEDAPELKPETNGHSHDHELELSEVKGLGETVRRRLEDRGLWSKDALRAASDDSLLAIKGIGPATLESLREAI